MINLLQFRPGFDAENLRLWIERHLFHAGEIERKRTVGHAIALETMSAAFDRNRFLVFPRPLDAGNHIVFGETGLHRRGFRFQSTVEQSAGLDVSSALGQVEGGFSRNRLPASQRHQQRGTAELEESTAVGKKIAGWLDRFDDDLFYDGFNGCTDFFDGRVWALI